MRWRQPVSSASTMVANTPYWQLIIKQKIYSRFIAIEDSKKGIAPMLSEAAELSISSLVGQNSFPHVTGGLGALAPELRFDTPNQVSVRQIDCI